MDKLNKFGNLDIKIRPWIWTLVITRQLAIIKWVKFR